MATALRSSRHGGHAGARVTDSRDRRRLNVVTEDARPVYVVWELTLRCDHACLHCGSRAGVSRDDELTTDEALDVVKQLAAMGAREVVLIGGEAYLHDGFIAIAKALRDAGVAVAVTTGGRGITPALAAEMRDAGITHVSVSIDGLEATHDWQRHRRGSYRDAIAALDHLRAAGVATASNINLNRKNQGEIEALYEQLRGRIASWQIQLTAPLGRAADRPDVLLQPFDLVELVPRIAQLKLRARTDGITITPGNNLGYFGPEETLLRSLAATDADHWQGCQAGRFVLGIESHGDVKGCPSLQSSHYVGGNLRRERLETIWQTAPLRFTRDRTVDDLWGFCRTCPFATTCMAGCSFTAHAVFGRPGNNPYCHYRARDFAKRGLQERLVHATPAPGVPFDSGTFEIVVEPYGSKVEMSELVSLRIPK